jgi:hypothetical protein
MGARTWRGQCPTCRGSGTLERKPDGMTWEEADEVGLLEVVDCRACGGNGAWMVEQFADLATIYGG